MVAGFKKLKKTLQIISESTFYDLLEKYLSGNETNKKALRY